MEVINVKDESLLLLSVCSTVILDRHPIEWKRDKTGMSPLARSPFSFCTQRILVTQIGLSGFYTALNERFRLLSFVLLFPIFSDEYFMS